MQKINTVFFFSSEYDAIVFQMYSCQEHTKTTSSKFCLTAISIVEISPMNTVMKCIFRSPLTRTYHEFANVYRWYDNISNTNRTISLVRNAYKHKIANYTGQRK